MKRIATSNLKRAVRNWSALSIIILLTACSAFSQGVTLSERQANAVLKDLDLYDLCQVEREGLQRSAVLQARQIQELSEQLARVQQAGEWKEKAHETTVQMYTEQNVSLQKQLNRERLRKKSIILGAIVVTVANLIF